LSVRSLRFANCFSRKVFLTCIKCFLPCHYSVAVTIQCLPQEGSSEYRLRVPSGMSYVTTVELHDISLFCTAWSAATRFSLPSCANYPRSFDYHLAFCLLFREILIRSETIFYILLGGRCANSSFYSVSYYLN
jgi:hypothetical protein